MLGSILVDPSVLSLVRLTPDDFYLERHSTIFKAMGALDGKQKPIDLISLKDKGIDPAYLLELVNATPTAWNVEFHADEVRGLSIKRRLLRASSQIAEYACTPGLNAEEAYCKAEALLTDQTPRSKTGPQSLDDLMADAIINFRLVSDTPRAVVGVPTGFDNLDGILKGLRQGLHIWCGVTSSGKTTFMLNVARQAALKHGVKTLILTLEMSEPQLAARLLSQQSTLPSSAIETGLHHEHPLQEYECDLVEGAHRQLSDLPIWILYAGGMTSLNLRMTMTQMRHQHDIQIAYVDYLQLMSDTDETEALALARATRNLKCAAGDLGIPVVALSQLKRGIEQRTEKIPTLSDFRGSGGIEENTDVAMAIHYEDGYHRFDPSYTSTGLVQACVLKDRLGSGAGSSCNFKLDRATTNLEPTERQMGGSERNK